MFSVTCTRFLVAEKMPNLRKSSNCDKVFARPTSRPKKRKFSGNQFTAEQETSSVSTSAEKLKNSVWKDIEIDDSHFYVILNFLTVFNFLLNI